MTTCMALDVDSAIRSHSQWKTRLASYLKHPDGSIDIATLAKHDQCALGKWIATDARKALSAGDLAALEQAHAAFHTEASTIARRADQGKSVSEEVALGAQSAYGRASSRVVQLLVSLRDR